MRDVVYLAVTLGFFAVAVLFVVGCARMVGPDDATLQADEDRADVASGACGADAVVARR